MGSLFCLKRDGRFMIGFIRPVKPGNKFFPVIIDRKQVRELHVVIRIGDFAVQQAGHSEFAAVFFHLRQELPDLGGAEISVCIDYLIFDAFHVFARKAFDIVIPDLLQEFIELGTGHLSPARWP